MSSEKILVKPTRAVAPGFEELSPLDQFTARLYMCTILLFKVESPSLRSVIQKDLELGLSHTLDIVTFLAGDLVPSNDRDLVQLEFTDDSGVWIHYDVQEDETFEHLESTHMLLTDALGERFIPEPKFHRQERTPALALKATFISGGLVLAILSHHNVMDGTGVGIFIDLWAKHAAAQADGTTVSDDMKPEAAALEPRLDWGTNSLPRDHFEVYQDQAPPDAGVMAQHLANRAEACEDGQEGGKAPLSHWVISVEALARLQTEASPPVPSLPALTDINIVMAALWQRISLARALPPTEMASLISAVNIRARMDPPLPDAYMRNAVTIGRTSLPVAQLGAQDTTGSSLYDLAHRVSDAIEWWTPERIWDFVSSIDSWDKVDGTAVPPMGHDVYVTMPGRLASLVWKTQWGGRLGAVKAIRNTIIPTVNGLVIVVPDVSGGLDIMMCTSDAALERLKNDVVWTSWASFRG